MSVFHMTDNLSVAVVAFASRMFMSVLVGETLVTRSVNISTNFKEPPFSVEMSPFWFKHMYSVICIDIEAYTTCFSVQAL